MLMTMTRHHIIHMMIPHQLLPQKNKQPTKSFFDELIQDCMASTSTFNDTESLIDEYLSTPCLLQAESTKEKAKETFKYPHQLLPQKTSNQQRAFLMS